MRTSVSSFIFVLFVLGCVEGSFLPYRRTSRQKRQSYQVTNYDIHRSIKILEKNLGLLQNKLIRHESREAQVADFSTKTLNAINSGQGFTRKATHAVSRQLIKMEERMLSLEALVTTTDERQRHLLSELGKGIDRLLVKPPPLPELPPLPSLVKVDNTKEFRKIVRKVNGLHDTMKNNFKDVNNEVKIVGESLAQHMEQLKTRHDVLWEDWNTCNSDHIRDIAKVSLELTETRNKFSDQITQAKDVLSLKEELGEECNSLSNELVDKLNGLDKAYQDQGKAFAASRQDTQKELQEQKENIMSLLNETRTERELAHTSFDDVLENLNNLKDLSSSEFNKMEMALDDAVEENTQRIASGVDSMTSVLKVQTSNIANILDDSVAQTDNLQDRLTEEFSALSKEISGLKKIEQVMLSTADAVLDTKRSIEFGIQQVIIELSDIVKNSGQNINSTLADQINKISFSILKNQTLALTRMTARMEEEISQVWRQIGIMYQEIEQSTDILGDLHSTTAQQMNASLDKVGSMDGTVGEINTKVADVEDNLNYLLGRLSLVVSEFSHMKAGVGAELDRLRDMTKDFSGNEIHEYKVNRRKRMTGPSNGVIQSINVQEEK